MKSPTIVLEIPVFQNIQDKDLRFLPFVLSDCFSGFTISERVEMAA